MLRNMNVERLERENNGWREYARKLENHLKEIVTEENETVRKVYISFARDYLEDLRLIPKRPESD